MHYVVFSSGDELKGMSTILACDRGAEIAGNALHRLTDALSAEYGREAELLVSGRVDDLVRRVPSTKPLTQTLVGRPNVILYFRTSEGLALGSRQGLTQAVVVWGSAPLAQLGPLAACLLVFAADPWSSRARELVGALGDRVSPRALADQVARASIDNKDDGRPPASQGTVDPVAILIQLGQLKPDVLVACSQLTRRNRYGRNSEPDALLTPLGRETYRGGWRGLALTGAARRLVGEMDFSGALERMQNQLDAAVGGKQSAEADLAALRAQLSELISRVERAESAAENAASETARARIFESRQMDRANSLTAELSDLRRVADEAHERIESLKRDLASERAAREAAESASSRWFEQQRNMLDEKLETADTSERRLADDLSGKVSELLPVLASAGASLLELIRSQVESAIVGQAIENLVSHRRQVE